LAPGAPGAALRVYPVDTFVSSDSPLESRRVAFAPLGHGPVLRAMDNATYAPRPLVDHALRLAGERGIPVQVGRTGGSTDGVPFISLGADVLPLSWPGRYSHSPVEVADLRDVANLVRLIVALAESPD
jgi:putative aminopeptidase FrvX